MDIFTLKGIIDELNNLAKNSIINKIYHNENELFLKLFGVKNYKNLYINISPSNQIITLTNKKFVSPTSKPTNFCMLLRKYIQNKKIKNFTLLGFYRILSIEFENYLLIIRFTGKSSDIILSDKDFNVIYSLKEKNNLKKFIIPEVKFYNSLEEFLNAKKIEGLPPFALKEIEFIKNNLGIKESYNYYKKLISFDIKLKPVKIEDKIYPFPMLHLGSNYKTCDSFIEIFNFEPDIKKELKKEISNKLKKAQKAFNKIIEELNEKKEFEKFFKYGELLKANLHNIKSGIEEIELLNYTENKKIKIKLDKNLTPIENMNLFFEKGKKYKRALEKLVERKNFIENEINYLNELLFFVENTDSIEELKNLYEEISPSSKDIQYKSSKPYKELYFNNIKILIGKTARGNDYILRKFGKAEFVWLHARGVPGAHVIIMRDFEELDNEIIYFAAQLALKNSKAKNDLKGDVIYTKIKYLKKPKNAFPGQVIVTKENVISVKIEDNEN